MISAQILLSRADKTSMIDFSAPLSGMDRASQRLEGVVQRLARISAAARDPRIR